MFMLRSVVTPPNDGGVTRGFFNDKLGFVALLWIVGNDLCVVPLLVVFALFVAMHHTPL